MIDSIDSTHILNKQYENIKPAMYDKTSIFDRIPPFTAKILSDILISFRRAIVKFFRFGYFY
jgi:hypothetical protein